MHDSSCSQFFSIEDAATCKLTRIICFLNFQLVWMENLADRLRRVFCMILDFFNFIPAKDPTDSLHQIGLHDVSFFLRVHLNRRAVQTHCVQVFSWCFTLTASLFQQKIWQTHFKNQPYIFGCQIISMKKTLHQTTLHFSPRPKLAATVQKSNHVSNIFWFWDL